MGSLFSRSNLSPTRFPRELNTIVVHYLWGGDFDVALAAIFSFEITFSLTLATKSTIINWLYQYYRGHISTTSIIRFGRELYTYRYEWQPTALRALLPVEVLQHTLSTKYFDRTNLLILYLRSCANVRLKTFLTSMQPEFAHLTTIIYNVISVEEPEDLHNILREEQGPGFFAHGITIQYLKDNLLQRKFPPVPHAHRHRSARRQKRHRKVLRGERYKEVAQKEKRTKWNEKRTKWN
jgi:hypothetical protein